MSRGRLRMPMFYKFFAGCALLALLLIFAGMLIVRHESKMRSRVDYLGKHYKRYLGYQFVANRFAGEQPVPERIVTPLPPMIVSLPVCVWMLKLSLPPPPCRVELASALPMSEN